jgi:hypothetical protein
MGHQPLLFFLKCLDDDTEVDDLIRREIKARQFFLLCDSPNARASRWVQQEVALIRELPDKVREDIDLESDWEAQLAGMAALSRRATVFLSYALADREIATRIATALRANDYRVFPDDASLSPGSSFKEAVEQQIDEAVETGFVLLLLSPDTARATFVWRETIYALQRSPGVVLPIIVSDPDLTRSLVSDSAGYADIEQLEFLDFTSGEFDDNFAVLMEALRR